MKTSIIILILLAAMASINIGCNTAHGLGTDVKKTGEKIEQGTAK